MVKDDSSEGGTCGPCEGISVEATRCCEGLKVVF